jgi:nitroimidazol reductase NimA-like FMN-containing flavoprotein (pyridoxamine 5'-phosphate oxidase superfamily)
LAGSDAIQPVLRRTLESQRYAVLATDDRGQPYTSLMAFAVTDDMTEVVLLTDRGTQKYANLMSNRRVAVFIDDRENSGADTRDAVAVTALGDAEEVDGDVCSGLRATYLVRHPYLADFAVSPSCAIIRVKVRRYVVVRCFQDVVEWCPVPQ